MARPQKPINWQEVEMSVMAGCNIEKVAAHQAIHPDTLRDRVLEEYGENYTCFSQRLKRKGESLLEVALLQKAMNNSHKGNTQMLIWLSKCKLGYREPEPIKERPPHDDQLELFLKQVKEPDNAIRDESEQKTTDDASTS